MSSFKASKCFEGSGPVVIWAVTARTAEGSWWKGYLHADAQQASFGVRLATQRAEGIKVNGAVVGLLRKHAKTCTIAGVFVDRESGHQWLPLFTGGGSQDSPRYWLQLAHGQPPELRFIAAPDTALVRKSSQGSFTKRRGVEGGVPAYPPPPSLNNILPSLLAAVSTAQAILGTPDQAEPAEASTELLPDYQRTARDRLKRRLKTLRKSVQKLHEQRLQAAGDLQLELQAKHLAAHLYKVRPGAEALLLDSAETGLPEPLLIPLKAQKTPGENLAELHRLIKKAKRGAGLLAEQQAATEASAALLAADLEPLRQTVYSQAQIDALYRRHQLRQEGQSAGPQQAAPGFRSCLWQGPGSTSRETGVRIFVGRSSADSDELCRQAKGHDLWLHVVQGTGSHVLIPAKQLTQKDAPPPALLRTAAILALHFSKHRDDQGGEVYLSRRQSIRKRTGMAPGLWQVDQAETRYVRYDSAELQQVLSQMETP